MSCVRRINASFSDSWLASAQQQQVRGKKKLVKQTNVTVRLLRDVTRYGRSGAIIPVPAGRMRNEFFPRRMAEYTTPALIKELGLEGQTFERDFSFGLKIAQNNKAEDDAIEPTPRAPRVGLDLLKHDQATEKISKLLPGNIDFFRTPINANTTPVQKRSPSLPASAQLSEAAGGNKQAPAEDSKAIYGSVSTSDIAASIRAMLTEDPDAARIVLGPEDISFAVATEESDRVKRLGTFEVDIKVKGSPKAVRRKITVNAQQ